MGKLPVRRFLTTTDILTEMYPGYVILLEPQGRNTVIVPTTPSVVVYGAGTAPFGGDPTMRIGYPGSLSAVASFNAGITNTVSWMVLHALFPTVVSAALSTFTNQPLVVSFDDASATYGRILTSALGSGGTGYTAGDDLTTAIGGSTVHAVTVSGPGAILTYTITDNLPEPVGVQDLSGGDGSGATLNILTTGPHGNGKLYLEFDYQVMTIPFPIH